MSSNKSASCLSLSSKSSRSISQTPLRSSSIRSRTDTQLLNFEEPVSSSFEIASKYSAAMGSDEDLQSPKLHKMSQMTASSGEDLFGSSSSLSSAPDQSAPHSSNADDQCRLPVMRSFAKEEPTGKKSNKAPMLQRFALPSTTIIPHQASLRPFSPLRQEQDVFAAALASYSSHSTTPECAVTDLAPPPSPVCFTRAMMGPRNNHGSRIQLLEARVRHGSVQMTEI